jgi:predicted transcriptional regulator
MTNSDIGHVVKEERHQAHMTVAQLAELVPADDRTIFRYESSGQIRPDVLARLVEIFKSNALRESYCKECPVKKVRFKKETPRIKQGIRKIAISLYHILGR